MTEPDPLTEVPPAPRTPFKLQATRFSGTDLVKLQEIAEILNTDDTDANRRAVRHSHWLLSLPGKGQTLMLRDNETGLLREVVILL